MKVSWLKLIWWVVIVAIVVLVIRAHWFQHPDAETPKPVETAPVSVEVPTPAPVETKPQPVIPPVIIRPQPVKKHALKSRVKHLSCSQVPTVAYSFSLSTVLATAKSRGLNDTQLADLTKCWQEHQSG